jgi:hypothetical protein
MPRPKPVEWSKETSKLITDMCCAKCTVAQIAKVVKLSIPMLKRYYGFELDVSDAERNACVVDKWYQACLAGEKWAITL